METLKKQVLALASEMKKHPTRTDPKLLGAGQACIALFQDENFGALILDFKPMMKNLFLESITDLAHGAPLLNHHALGISFFEGRLVRYTLPLTETNSFGTVVCSIQRKSSAFDQEQINASIYLLTFHLSKY